MPSLEDKVRKMIDEDLVVSNLNLNFSKLSDMSPEFIWSTGQIGFWVGIKNNSWIRFACIGTHVDWLSSRAAFILTSDDQNHLQE